jgi:hypothetical protein
MLNFNQLFISFQLRFFKRKIIENLFNTKKSKRALLYYKTDPFFSKRMVNAYSHTNNGEIVIIANLLNKHGFDIDVIDRTAVWDEINTLIDNKYDLFLGIGSGNFNYFTEIKSRFNIYHTILIATGPEPRVSNKLVTKAHSDCMKRTLSEFKIRRLIKSSDQSIIKRYENIDSILYYGSSFARKGWEQICNNLFEITPSTSPFIRFSLEDLYLKEQNRFIYFGANGLICKGLDLVIEAFDGLDDVFLDICAPQDEIDFWNYYLPIVERNKSINLHGFVGVGSDLFNELTAKASFNIFPGSAEGCATSVITMMRRGVIPVITYETGLSDNSVQYLIKERSVKEIRRIIKKLMKITLEERNSKIIDTYIESCSYSNESFSTSFETGLIKSLSQKK